MKLIHVKAALFTFCFACAPLSQTAYATQYYDPALQICSNQMVADVGEQMHIANFAYSQNAYEATAETGGVIVAGVCKVWPKDNDITIVAFAYNAGVADEKSLILATINSRTHAIIARYKSVIQEDAGMRVENSSLHIDTARYDLAKGVRAIGLDMTSGYIPHCEDGGIGSQRTLFVQETDALRPVLENFIMSEWQYTQGGNVRCTGPNSPEVITQESQYHIAMSPKYTHGFADLIISATNSTHNIESDKTTKMSTSVQYTLHYDGKTYQRIAPNSSKK